MLARYKRVNGRKKGGLGRRYTALEGERTGGEAGNGGGRGAGNRESAAG